MRLTLGPQHLWELSINGRLWGFRLSCQPALSVSGDIKFLALKYSQAVDRSLHLDGETHSYRTDPLGSKTLCGIRIRND